MTDSNRVEIVRQFLRHLTSKRNIQHYDAYLHQDVIIHDSIFGKPVQGLQAVKRIEVDQIPACQESFEIEEILEVRDRVIVRWVSKLRSKAKIPDTTDIFGLSIFKFIENTVVEIWHYWDRLALLGKLGKTLLKFDLPEEIGHYPIASEDHDQYISLRALLSNRERDCLRALLDGKTAKETAEVYGISARTIEQYFENIKLKCKCSSKRDLFKIAKVLEALQLL